MAYGQEEKESFWDKMKAYHNIIRSLVQGSLDSRGLAPDTLFRPNLASWESVHTDINDQLATAQCESKACEDYQNDFAAVVKSRLTRAHQTEVLSNKRSFELRHELIKSAQKSIHLLVWAIYDDETGKAFHDQLISALMKNPHLDIKIILDGNMANMFGRKTLKSIEKISGGRVKILRWKSKRYSASGNHRKLLIIDGEHVIVGGMNIGNTYSHKAGKDFWRDLDLYIFSKMAGEAASNQFSEIWNKQLTEFPKLLKKLDALSETSSLFFKGEGTPVIFVDQHPGSAVKDAYHNIHTAIVKLFRDATHSIDIENAYFILDPIIRKELEAAIKRGIKVRIFTNSDTSVDEPIVSAPIMKSARDAALMGAEVYLRKGTTLHSKYLVVDQEISMVGSFNFHPRSLRFDAENVAIIFDGALAAELTATFEEGIHSATYIHDPKNLLINWDLVGILTEKFYFDFL